MGSLSIHRSLRPESRRRSFSPHLIWMIFGNSEAPNHGEWIIGAPERRSLHATAHNKISNYGSPPKHDRLLLPKYVSALSEARFPKKKCTSTVLLRAVA